MHADKQTMTTSTKSSRVRSFVVSFTVAVFLLALISPSNAYVYLKEVQAISNKCVATNGDLKAVGEKWYDDVNCEVYRCFQSSGEKFYEHISGCGTVSADKGCTVEQGVGHYPNCCPVVNCPNPVDDKLQKDTEIIFTEQQI